MFPDTVCVITAREDLLLNQRLECESIYLSYYIWNINFISRQVALMLCCECITYCRTLCRSWPRTRCTPWPPRWGRPQCSPQESPGMAFLILQKISLSLYTSSRGLFWCSYDHHLQCCEVFWLVVFLSPSPPRAHQPPHPRLDLLQTLQRNHPWDKRPGHYRSLRNKRLQQ